MLKIQKIYKPIGPWSKQVQSFLKYLHERGFKKVSKPLGFDNNGYEVLGFVNGKTCDYPLSDNVRSIDALISSAKLLREYHDISQNYLSAINTLNQKWMFFPREPQEVVCHNDFAPYNICFKGQEAVGIIDFETACPAPRVWDIAYTLYRFAPFTNPNNKDGFGNIKEQILRAHSFCDAYGLSKEDRVNLVDSIIERLEVLLNFLLNSAKKGDNKYQNNINDGHHLTYLADIEYIKKYKNIIQSELQD